MKCNIIAIEREYASGGSEIGGKLAAKLGIPCYGQEILEKAAARLKLPLQELARIEEDTTSSFLFGLAAFANLTSGIEVDLVRIEQKLAFEEESIIHDMAVSPCVFVGRRAAALLRNKDDVLKVFIRADYSMRIERAINVYGHDPKQAELILRRYDKRRANYFKATIETDWKDANIYHMILDSGKLGIDKVVDILCETVK